LLAQLRAAHHSIDAAIFSFTVDRIAAVLDSAAERGVEVRVVADKQQAGSSYSVVDALAKGIRVRIGTGSGYMHNKFAIVDDSVCITGSYNWSEAAETKNDENLLVLVSPELAKVFETQYEVLWARAKTALSVAAKPAPAGTLSKPAAASAPRVRPGATGKASSGGDDVVYITKSGRKYHGAGCRYLSKSCIPISRKDAEARGYTPCSQCRP
jgi:phosphatidylserine/phosphatidylglycerophosphate/cardiolipin synthase-like enzyme